MQLIASRQRLHFRVGRFCIFSDTIKWNLLLSARAITTGKPERKKIMTNYYEILSNKRTQLNREDSAAELRGKLIELESLWTDRAAVQPDKATEMLVLISQARKAFADEKSKAAYDRELFAPPKEEKREDPDAARRAEFQKWQNKAAEYAQSHQNDLAKTAIEQAMKFQADDDCDFLYLAATIYQKNGEFQAALNYINKAIVLAPQTVDLYTSKAQILEELSLKEKSTTKVNQACTFSRRSALFAWHLKWRQSKKIPRHRRGQMAFGRVFCISMNRRIFRWLGYW